MDAVTFPETGVVTFIEENLIPLRIKYDAQPYAEDFRVKWTPTIITLEPDGTEHHRTVGFLGPDEFIPSLLLGRGKVHFDHDRFSEALESLEEVVDKYPRSDSTPEAIYLRGVSRYKSSNTPKALKEAYEKLNAEFPANQWTKRAYPYRLI